ncbi:MAG TPA: DUF1801 domain-containing protein [Parvularculaceae bacterium]|nr:DUF1801 domain-containing protein [Caulobacterales bacterium]HOP19205.1 DUF1801 domain-containing protein [Amphiplicatus sp.]HPE31493.1 DUF1801 domain-containing protein [Parvularculaceae bacterium]
MITKRPAAKKKAAKVVKKTKKAARAEPKTRATEKSVSAFIDAVPNETRKADAKALLAMMKRVTGEEPKMWGPSIVGFGSYHYKYESGRDGDMPMTGFSPRGAASVVYVMGGAPETDPLFAKLGKFKSGKSCLYINRLADIDMKTLEAIVKKSLAYMRKTYGGKA